MKYHRRGILAFFLFVLIFAAAFLMYRLPLAAVAYPAVLCAVLGGLLLAADYRRMRIRHEELEQILKLPACLIENFPRAHSIEEEDYRQLVTLLCEEIRQIETDTDCKYQDMIDYYTAWAHQIKTPIASMKLTLQNEDSDLARRLSGDLLRIEQYVEMVMTFLRLDSENTDYVISSCDLDEVIRQAVRKFSNEFISRRIGLEYEPVKETVITDEKWLSFVIEQLLSNALKYTKKGKISISMEAPKTLCIADTGMGIGPEDLPRIFEKGYTGYNGRRDKKASGLGLYLCKRICRNLGHDIKAESVPGEGTVIKIDLSQEDVRGE